MADGNEDAKRKLELEATRSVTPRIESISDALTSHGDSQQGAGSSSGPKATAEDEKRKEERMKEESKHLRDFAEQMKTQMELISSMNLRSDEKFQAMATIMAQQNQMLMSVIGKGVGGEDKQEAATTTKNDDTRKLHPDITEQFAELAKATEKQLIKFVKAARRLKVADQHIEKYDKGEYPENVKEMNPPYEQEALDEPWSETTMDEHRVTVVVPKDSTRRQAMKAVHLGMHRQIKIIDREALKQDAEQLETSSSRATFREQCSHIRVKESSRHGLEDPNKMMAVDGKIRDDAVEKLYDNAVKKADKVLAGYTQNDEKKRKAEEENKEQVATDEVDRQIATFVENIVDSKLGKGKGNGKDKDSGKGNLSKKQSKKTMSQSKNYWSPPGGVGYSYKDKKNGKGKGSDTKGKNKGKQKGKDKGKGKSKGKPGKGKGSK